MTMTAAAKINVDTWQAHVCARAAAKAGAVAMGGSRAAAVCHRAPAIDRAAVAVAANHGTLAIDRGAAAVAGVGEAAAGAAMGMGAAAVVRLRSSGSHDSETGGDGQESDDLFHEDGVRFDCFVFDLLPHHLQLWIQTRLLSGYSSIREIFSAHSTGR